jgi:predicted RNA-binding Zn ribbon-like protein
LKHVLPVSIESHAFSPADFVGGEPALDFANTIAGWNGNPRDWLDSYDSLAGWARQAGVIPDELSAALRRQAEIEPKAAGMALRQARSLREDIHEYFCAIARETTPDSRVIESLFSRWRKAADSHAPNIEEGRLVLEPKRKALLLGVITDRLAYLAFELARTVDADRLRVCDGANCGWLFIDRSKAGRRRWCDMATCGNAAKSRRHYERKAGE